MDFLKYYFTYSQTEIRMLFLLSVALLSFDIYILSTSRFLHLHLLPYINFYSSFIKAILL